VTSPGDRRQELRREEDEAVAVILAKHGLRLDQHDKLLAAVGTSMGHLTVLDSRVDGHEKRLDEHNQILHEIHEKLSDLALTLKGVTTTIAIWATVGAIAGAGLVTVVGTRNYSRTVDAGITDADTIVALGVVVGFIPAAITWAVSLRGN
jgi:hypothetical protein